MHATTLTKHLLAITLSCVLTTVCAKKALHIKPDPKLHQTAVVAGTHTTLKHPAVFEHIDARGPILIRLHQKNGAPTQVHISGPSKQIHALHVVDYRGSLHLDMQDHSCAKPPCVTVEVQAPTITGMSLAGDVQLHGQMTQSTPMNVWLRDQSKLALDGLIHIQRLVQRDHSESTIAFVNSPALSVHLSDHSHSRLGGRVEQLTVKALQVSRLDGQFLRSYHNWIQSHGHAIVMTYPLNSLNAFAIDEGNVWVFNDTSNVLNDTFSSGSGNVLEMEP